MTVAEGDISLEKLLALMDGECEFLFLISSYKISISPSETLHRRVFFLCPSIFISLCWRSCSLSPLGGLSSPLPYTRLALALIQFYNQHLHFIKVHTPESRVN